MKGLLYKEFLLLWHNHKSNLFATAMLLLGFGILYFDAPFNSFYAYIVGTAPCFICANLCVASIMRDETEKWSTYAAALPVSAAEYVSAKYIVHLLIQTAVFAACSAVVITKGLTLYGCTMLIVFATTCFFAEGIFLPGSFAFPGEQEKQTTYTLLMVCLLILALVLALPFIEHDNGGEETVADVLPMVRAVCLGSVGVFFLSWPISIKLYERRTY